MRPRRPQLHRHPGSRDQARNAGIERLLEFGVAGVALVQIEFLAPFHIDGVLDQFFQRQLPVLLVRVVLYLRLEVRVLEHVPRYVDELDALFFRRGFPAREMPLVELADDFVQRM